MLDEPVTEGAARRRFMHALALCLLACGPADRGPFPRHQEEWGLDFSASGSCPGTPAHLYFVLDRDPVRVEAASGVTGHGTVADDGARSQVVMVIDYADGGHLVLNLQANSDAVVGAAGFSASRCTTALGVTGWRY